MKGMLVVPINNTPPIFAANSILFYCALDVSPMVINRALSVHAHRYKGSAFSLGGPGWTRTNVADRRRVYSPLQLPLCDRPKYRNGFCCGKP